MVYSSFEKTCLNGLGKTFPDLSKELRAIVGRFVDLYTLIKAHAYHPDFKCSFSIKYVLPALVPKLSYDDLDIADGTAASLSFARMLRAECGDEERGRLRGDLLAYCERDTLAMVEVYWVFCGVRS